MQVRSFQNKGKIRIFQYFLKRMRGAKSLNPVHACINLFVLRINPLVTGNAHFFDIHSVGQSVGRQGPCFFEEGTPVAADEAASYSRSSTKS